MYKKRIEETPHLNISFDTDKGYHVGVFSGKTCTVILKLIFAFSCQTQIQKEVNNWFALNFLFN